MRVLPHVGAGPREGETASQGIKKAAPPLMTGWTGLVLNTLLLRSRGVGLFNVIYDECHLFINALVGRVQRDGVVGSTQGGDVSGPITPVSFFDFAPNL